MKHNLGIKILTGLSYYWDLRSIENHERKKFDKNRVGISLILV